MITRTSIIITTLSLALPASALAEPLAEPADTNDDATAFVETSGAFGFQFGSTPYVPDGDAMTYKNPLTNGFAAGLTAGYAVLPGLFIVANYEYTKADSRDGEIEGAFDAIEGTITYQTLVLGLRSARRLGPGILFGELAIGAVLPFETELQFDYVEGAPVDEGAQVSEYNLGFGAHGALGYQYLLTPDVYLGGALKVKGFSTNNEGKTTTLTNVPTGSGVANGEIQYETEGVNGMDIQNPETYSVQDLRAQLVVGYRF